MMDNDQSHEGASRGSAMTRACIEDLRRHGTCSDSYLVGYFRALFSGLLGYYTGRVGKQETEKLIAEMTWLLQHGRALHKATPPTRLH